MNAPLPASETIAAIATPAGRGGIGVIRISGDRIAHIAEHLLGGLPAPRHAALRFFLDAQGEQIDAGLALYFPAPASFTGDDVLELHAHGSPVVLDMLLARVLELGARLAGPGEFSRRAFLNDKIDLTQAEAIADLIDCSSTQAARAALRSLQGEFSAAVNSLADAITETRMHVEAALDFPEEEIDFLADGTLQQRIDACLQLGIEITTTAKQGALLREGITVVIAGRPNAGKSSLLNRLAGHDAAIVTDTPGTTRDVLRERIQIDGIPLHVADTAGLREDADAIEGEGIRRAQLEMRKADHILYVIDGTRGLDDEDLRRETAALPTDVAVTWVYNKIDLSGAKARLDNYQPPRVHLSAVTGEGMDLLRDHLKACAGFQQGEAGVVSARRRHLDALGQVHHHLQQAATLLYERRAGELIAEELRLAQQRVGEITGAVTSDDLLGKIFASFCIGK
jgi:tRNA modification GTPase